MSVLVNGKTIRKQDH